MRLFFILLIVISQHNSYGQESTKKMNAWDSLRIRTLAEVQKHDEVLRKELSYTDTLRLKDEIIITYFSSDKRKLRKVSNNLDIDGCVRGILYEYFNINDLIEFQTGYKKCCPQDTVGGYKCFERVTDYSRFEYDDKGRVVVHVFHVTTPGTYRETITYSQEGNKEIKRQKIIETMFWD